MELTKNMYHSFKNFTHKNRFVSHRIHPSLSLLSPIPPNFPPPPLVSRYPSLPFPLIKGLSSTRQQPTGQNMIQEDKSKALILRLDMTT